MKNFRIGRIAFDDSETVRIAAVYPAAFRIKNFVPNEPWLSLAVLNDPLVIDNEFYGLLRGEVRTRFLVGDARRTTDVFDFLGQSGGGYLEVALYASTKSDPEFADLPSIVDLVSSKSTVFKNNGSNATDDFNP